MPVRSPVEGSLEIEVLSHGHATCAAFYGRELAGAAVFLPSGLAVTPHGEEFGDGPAPTLAAAGIGLIVGDVTTAAAILRPDYATGPGMGVSLGSLHDVATCGGKEFWRATPPLSAASLRPTCFCSTTCR